ncbi:hypothetical protein NW767_014039 [Fusarium falciforme]|nr:hypothetical protein NW767_014039 [Fusarium falciforme]
MCWVWTVSKDIRFGIQHSDQAEIEALSTVRSARERRTKLEGSQAWHDAKHGFTSSAHLVDALLRHIGLELEENCES